MKMTLCALAVAAFALTACAKPEQAPANEQAETSTNTTTEVSAEQQALIDSVDQPIEEPVVETAAPELTDQAVAVEATESTPESAQ